MTTTLLKTTDIVKHLSDFLSPKEIILLIRVSSFYRKCFNESFWKKKVKRDHGIEALIDAKTWKGSCMFLYIGCIICSESLMDKYSTYKLRMCDECISKHFNNFEYRTKMNRYFSKSPFFFRTIKDEIRNLARKREGTSYIFRIRYDFQCQQEYYDVNIGKLICSGGNLWDVLLRFDEYIKSHAKFEEKYEEYKCNYLQDLFIFTLIGDGCCDLTSEMIDVQNLTDSPIHQFLRKLAIAASDPCREREPIIVEITTHI